MQSCTSIIVIMSIIIVVTLVGHMIESRARCRYRLLIAASSQCSQQCSQQCSAGCTSVVRPGLLSSSFFLLSFIFLYPCSLSSTLCLVLYLSSYSHSHRLPALHHHRPPDRSRYRHASSSSAVKSFHHPFSASSLPRFIILLFHHIILHACLLLIYAESSWFVLLQPSALTVCSALTALPTVD